MYTEKDTQDADITEMSYRELVPQGDTISLETIVNILVKKGLCTTEELFKEEGFIRQKREQLEREEYKKISNINHYQRRHHNSTIKRLFSKRRWTRRLGTALFGWKWKKVKKRSSDLESVQELHEDVIESNFPSIANSEKKNCVIDK